MKSVARFPPASSRISAIAAFPARIFKQTAPSSEQRRNDVTGIDNAVYCRSSVMVAVCVMFPGVAVTVSEYVQLASAA
jgi:hypothetical protein